MRATGIFDATCKNCACSGASANGHRTEHTEGVRTNRGYDLDCPLLVCKLYLQVLFHKTTAVQ